MRNAYIKKIWKREAGTHITGGSTSDIFISFRSHSVFIHNNFFSFLVLKWHSGVLAFWFVGGSKCAHCLYATKYGVCVSTVAPINAPGTL